MTTTNHSHVSYLISTTNLFSRTLSMFIAASANCSSNNFRKWCKCNSQHSCFTLNLHREKYMHITESLTQEIYTNTQKVREKENLANWSKHVLYICKCIAMIFWWCTMAFVCARMSKYSFYQGKKNCVHKWHLIKWIKPKNIIIEWKLHFLVHFIWFRKHFSSE